jgi:hypothetical protein
MKRWSLPQAIHRCDAVHHIHAVHDVVAEGEVITRLQVAQLCIGLAVHDDGAIIRQIELLRAEGMFRLHGAIVQVNRRE